jgi:hypothetical protein
MTLIEVLTSIAIMAVIIGLTSTMVSTMMRGTQDNINRQFATQKAVSMLEELRALIQTQNGTTTVVLDDYDDGTTNQTLLTTQRSITDPAHPASGNTRVNGNWLFERRITVQRVAGASDLRIVNVKVFVREGSRPPRQLAEVAGVLSTIGQNMPPTQVYDVYLVAIENVPGWWLYMDNVVPFVESAMEDLESRHPGLLFRKHWIRKLSYGRDPLYTPYVNSQLDSTQPINSVYFYPGKLPAGSPVENYYPPDIFTARVSVDGTVKNGGNLSYALADQYNHAMRYPEEAAMFQARVNAGLDTLDAPPWRLLMDDMILRPDLYKNAIVINLHGELFPFPPIRNYSDAAKDPLLYPYTRVVTHPERIHYGNSDGVNLRVYSYHNNVASPGSVPERLARPISIVLKDIQWVPGATAITAISGGVDNDGNSAPDPYTTPFATTTPSTNGMYFTFQILGNDTILRLYNSPLKSPCVQVTNPCDRGGLHSSKQLYALEYIPSPVENLPDPTSPAAFSTNLGSTGNASKNTARWVINIPSSVLTNNRMYEFDTRIDDDLTTGTAANKPWNVSRTYVWRGTDTWLFGNATTNPNMPMSERFQVLGDPRHCPYADLKLPHATSGLARADALGMGYNRYFDDFHTNGNGNNAAATWPGWSYAAPALSSNWYGIKNNTADTTTTNDGWATPDGYLEIDVPRIYQILRNAVIRPNAVYTTMTGFSYYYVGIGGEIGYDQANNFPNSIPVSSKPFTGGTGSRYEQSILPDGGGGVKYIRENVTTTDYWWAMYWLGELAPDSAWATYVSTGNLPTGTGGGTFSRVMRGTIDQRLPTGTALIDAVRRTHRPGCTTFFWSGSTNSTFHHVPAADTTTATLVTDGQAIANTYELPLASSIANNRPFEVNINDTGSNPDHFLQPAYGSATSLSTLSELYRHQSGIKGSALLTMRDGNNAAFVVVNGLSPAGQSGIAFISRWSFLSLIQSFLTAGLYSTGGSPDPARVRELSRVVITNPNVAVDLDDPSTINVTWTSQWRRWDGLPYTPAYSNTFAETTTVRYTPLYSRDNGRTWLHMQDDTPASIGVRPAATYLQTALNYNWSVPTQNFPKGNYLIRIEAYRDEVPLHYSFHQYRAFIKRPS